MTAEHEGLIRRVLGASFLELKLDRVVIDEKGDDGTIVKIGVLEGDTKVEAEGKGVGMVDAMFGSLMERYGREYQSLTKLRLLAFHVAADVETKKAQAGVDAVGKVTLEVANSEGKHFTFSDASRSMTASTARVVIAMVQYFVNAERAFVMLHNARKDAAERGREDLVSRYTAEMAEIVESTSYVDVIKK